jgi:general secretion pathway protein M
MNARLQALTDRARAWYEGLAEREQRMVAGGGVLVAVMVLFGGLLLPLQAAVSKAQSRSESRRADLAWMRGNADEIRAGMLALPRETDEAPVVLVNRVGRENGLEAALRGSQPSAGGHGVRVQLEAAPFDAMITWLAALEEHYGLSIDAVTVERSARPGVVNATITLNQPK